MLKRILKEYSFYTFSFFISAIVTILCAFISCPDANHWCSSFLSLIFTIASAVLANCIFCLFQVIIPERKAKKEIAGKLTNELEIILKLISVDFPSFFTNKQSVTIYPSAFDLPAFRQYCDRLEQEKNGIIKKYPEIFSKTISRA